MMKRFDRYKSERRVSLFAALLIVPCGLYAQSFKDQIPAEVPVQRAFGDSVQPVFDGWHQNSDGTITMWFGYMNRNFKEEVDVPIGSTNSFSNDADRGQPTHFYPRRRQYVFKVDLPKGWTKEQKLVWTLTSHGETCTATGWMQPEWEVDDGVRMMNAGAGLAPPEDNQAPRITAGSADQTVAVGKPLRLSVSATDDGIPKARGARGGTGVKWILYRGPGRAVFDPDTTPPVSGKPVESSTSAFFSAPGNYWLQAVVSDGLLETFHNVKVTVTP
jgi:hypothetical protein